jgi:hypothetical protein
MLQHVVSAKHLRLLAALNREGERVQRVVAEAVDVALGGLLPLVAALVEEEVPVAALAVEVREPERVPALVEPVEEVVLPNLASARMVEPVVLEVAVAPNLASARMVEPDAAVVAEREHAALLREVERERALFELDKIKFEREKMSLELDILRERRKRAAFVPPLKVVKIEDSPPVEVVEVFDSPPVRIPRVWDCEGDRIRAAYAERAERLIAERGLLSSQGSSVSPPAPEFLPFERVEREEGEVCDLPTDLVELLDERPAICASRALCDVVNSLPR